MKIIAMLLSCFMFISCSKKNNLNGVKQAEEKQVFLSQNVPDQEEQKTSLYDEKYIFDIDSFKYLDEFPRSITGIKEMYPDENFEERITESNMKGLPIGKYIYSLDSTNIQFGFWGDTVEEAKLDVVHIYNQKYQCKAMQVIGMSVSKLESVSGKKLTPEKDICIYTEEYILVIETQNDIVSSYAIITRI